MNLSLLKEIDNKQLYNFTREQTQVFLTARVGDGCISTTNSGSTYYSSNCKYPEYLEYKKVLIGKGKIKKLAHNGYAQTPIYTYYGGAHPDLLKIKNLSLKEVLNNLDELGLALWFYDDGSLHQRDHYYNLNTQKFSQKDHEEVIVPYFNSIGLYPSIRQDRRKDKNLYYLGFNKYRGAFDITQLLAKFPLKCYSYKLWSPETIQKWSNLQEKVKSIEEPLTERQLARKWASS